MKTQASQFLVTCTLFVLLSVSALSQTMTINPGNAIKPGETVTVTYADPGRANQTIVVTVSNNELPPNLQEENLFITLDGHGKGSGQWTAPAKWDSATFVAAGVTEVTVVIGPAESGEGDSGRAAAVRSVVRQPAAVRAFARSGA